MTLTLESERGKIHPDLATRYDVWEDYLFSLSLFPPYHLFIGKYWVSVKLSIVLVVAQILLISSGTSVCNRVSDMSAYLFTFHIFVFFMTGVQKEPFKK